MTVEDLEHSHSAAAIAARLRSGPRASYLRDLVFGGIDGAVTTFAVVAGVMGAELEPRIVLILGMANLLGDGFSMAAGKYSSTKTEIDQYHFTRDEEATHITLAPEGEREEVRQVLQRIGLKGATLDEAVDVLIKTRKGWLDLIMTEEFGMTPMTRSPIRAALMTFIAFICCGSIPLLPYVFLSGTPILPATIMTALTFFVIGSLRSRWSPHPWWRTGLETFAVGMAAAGVAYLVGYSLQGLV